MLSKTGNGGTTCALRIKTLCPLIIVGVGCEISSVCEGEVLAELSVSDGLAKLLSSVVIVIGGTPNDPERAVLLFSIVVRFSEE